MLVKAFANPVDGVVNRLDWVNEDVVLGPKTEVDCPKELLV